MPATRTRRPAKRAPAKRQPAKRGATKRGATKRAPAKPKAKRSAQKKRAPAKRRPPRRAPARRTPRRRSSVRRTVAASSWRTRLVVLASLLLAAGAGYVFWLRDSSLVAINDVEVVGVTTSDRGEIVTALTDAAEDMTTLHYDGGRLEQIATRFPTVAAIDIDPNFPHGMRLEITQRPPRLMADSAGRQTPVAADGTLLPGVTVPEDRTLPVLEVKDPPAGATLTGEPLEQAEVIGSAPDPLLPLVEGSEVSDFGVVLIMRGGIEIRFGTTDRVDDKWAAAAAVLADPKLDAVAYVDVRVPERPASG